MPCQRVPHSGNEFHNRGTERVMAMVGISSSWALVGAAPAAASIVAASSSSSSPPGSLALASSAVSLSGGFLQSSGQARWSLRQFDGLRGEGSVGTMHSLRGISTERAFSVRASSTLQAPSKQKIRIKLKSYWTHLIQQACQQILEAAKNTNAESMGPVPLPTKKRVYCVLRSPHVDKDSREHFEIRTHHRLIDLMNPNAQTIDALMQLDLPAGVDVEVKLS